MAQIRLTMRHIQEILRLKHQNQLLIREIARSCGLPASTVGDYLKRAEAAGIGWPLPEGQSEKELLGRLIPGPAEGAADSPVLPEWGSIHKELSRQAASTAWLHHGDFAEGNRLSKLKVYRANSAAASSYSSNTKDINRPAH